MKRLPNSKYSEGSLTAYLSPLSAWALAFGCAVGWGSFVMPGTTFLPPAGPLGAVLGLLLGAGVMLIIGISYHILMKRYPGAGGSYTFAKEVLGRDHGFLCAWMLFLTYVAIIWANSTALSLIVRYLFGDVLCFGFSYQIAGYTIYFGELLLSVAVVALTCAVCLLGNKVTKWVQTICAAALFIGITVCFIAVLIHRGGFSALAPAFAEGDSRAVQVLGIVILAPWAFIGFESISHSSGEFRFPVKKSLPVLIAALAAAALAYIMLTLCAALAVPDGYSGWGEYISDLVRLDGIKGLPTFCAAQQAMGAPGLVILGISAFCGIATGLIANYVALGRLIHSLSKDNMAPKVFGGITRRGVPGAATMLVAACSCIMPFLGRTAIGWIVDVTTIGATLVYSYTSLSTFAVGRRERNRAAIAAGLAGLVFSLMFAVIYLLPGVTATGNLAPESYLILIIWSVLGMLVFRVLVQRDVSRRLGKSQIVWVILFLLIMTVSIVWLHQVTTAEAMDIAGDVGVYNAEQARAAGIDDSIGIIKATNEKITERFYDFSENVMRSVYVQTFLILAALAVIFSIYSVIKKREKQIEAERRLAEESSKAKTAFLSNMSHDIRTPMNAITGYTALALEEKDDPEAVRGYLEKIDVSSRHLLTLINDILDMSRIESGKMELDEAPADLCAIVDEIYDISSVQMKQKDISCTADHSGVTDRHVICDKKRLSRILLNLLSNACKFTPEGGSVSVTLRQTGAENGRGSYELTVSDTGIGMSEEFAARIFDEFKRERSRTVSNIEGTGLGMSITKQFVELMGGTIELDTEKGKGTTFTVRLDLALSDEAAAAAPGEVAAEEPKRDLSGTRVLLADDNPINIEIASAILAHEGFIVETAENGKQAADMLAGADEDRFGLVIMDIQMPVMNGLDATRLIRSMEGRRGSIPIIALTANTFEDDRSEAAEAGMNALVSKPLVPQELFDTIYSLIQGEAK